MGKILIPSLVAAMAAGAGLYREGDPTTANGTGVAAGTPATAAPVAPPAPNEYVDMKAQNFHFKKEKDIVATGEDGKPKTDEKGNPVVLQVGVKHPTVPMFLPVPKQARLIEFLSDPQKFPKEVELINSAIFDVIYGAARAQINEFREKDPKATVTQAVLNFDDLDFTKIANTPKAERGAYSPDETDLKTFLESYKTVMPAAANKSEAQIANHIILFQGGFKKQKAQKDVLEMMLGMLKVYATAAPEDDLEENQQVFEYFANKLDRWSKAEEKITMDML